MDKYSTMQITRRKRRVIRFSILLNFIQLQGVWKSEYWLRSKTLGPLVLEILNLEFFIFWSKSSRAWLFPTAFYIHVTVRRNRFLLHNQPDALIFQIYSVIKLYMFPASSMPIIRMDEVPSWLCLEAVIRNLHETYQCRMYGRKLLMMGGEDARDM
jgi:hypothetical protein